MPTKVVELRAGATAAANAAGTKTMIVLVNMLEISLKTAWGDCGAKTVVPY